MFGVIIIHCNTLISPEFSGTAVFWAGTALRSLSCFAVPYFFILSGYLFVESASRRGIPESELFKKYLKRFVPIFLAWSLIYAFVPHRFMETILDKGIVEGGLKRCYWHLRETLDDFFMHPLLFLFHGSRIHLWFLSSLLMALGMWSFFRKFLPGREKLCVFLGAMGYLYASAVVVYSAPLGISFPEKYTDEFYSHAQSLVGFLFVPLGALMKVCSWRASAQTQKLLILAGLLMIVLERFLQQQLKDPASFLVHGILWGTVPLAAGIFQAALAHPDWGRKTFFEKLGPDMLGVYLIHYLVFEALVFKPAVVMELLRPLLIFGVSMGAVYIIKRIKPLAFLVSS